MELNIIGALKNALDEKDLKELMREKTALPEAAMQESAAVAASAGPAVVNNISSVNEESSGNLMSRNFTGASEESQYLKAAKEGRAAAREIEASLGEIILSTMPERLQEAARKHGDERMSRIHRAKEELEAAQPALDQMKAVVAENAAEALAEAAVVEAAGEAAAQTDAKDEPTQSVATGEAGAAAANPQVAAAALSAYNPAAAAAAITPAPAAPEAPNLESGASTGNGVAKVSVDVSV